MTQKNFSNARVLLPDEMVDEWGLLPQAPAGTEWVREFTWCGFELKRRAAGRGPDEAEA